MSWYFPEYTFTKSCKSIWLIKNARETMDFNVPQFFGIFSNYRDYKSVFRPKSLRTTTSKNIFVKERWNINPSSFYNLDSFY